MAKTCVRRHSKQRDAILQALQSTKEHPTADWVYERVRQEIPNISLGTVYRNLAGLWKDGLICRMEVGDGIEHYDANFEPHYHLVCKACGRLLDLDLPYDSALNSKVEKAVKAQIDHHNLLFHGTCGNCCAETEKE